jgi:hypothetical protein
VRSRGRVTQEHKANVRDGAFMGKAIKGGRMTTQPSSNEQVEDDCETCGGTGEIFTLEREELPCPSCVSRELNQQIAELRAAHEPKTEDEIDASINRRIESKSQYKRLVVQGAIQPPSADLESLIDSFMWAVRRDNDAGDQYTRQEVRDTRKELVAAYSVQPPSLTRDDLLSLVRHVWLTTTEREPPTDMAECVLDNWEHPGSVLTKGIAP